MCTHASKCRLSKLTEVVEIVSLSASSVFRRRKSGDFPKPIRVGFPFKARLAGGTAARIFPSCNCSDIDLDHLWFETCGIDHDHFAPSAAAGDHAGCASSESSSVSRMAPEPSAFMT